MNLATCVGRLDDVMVCDASGTNLSTGENMPECFIRYEGWPTLDNNRDEEKKELKQIERRDMG